MRKALITGIDNYPYSKLYGCVNDAQAVAELLGTNGDDTPNFDIRLEKDVPTKMLLKEAIYKLFNCDYDTCLLYYSGHGGINSYGNGYIVTPDVLTSSKTDINDGLSMDEILTMANNSRARNKIIILDCCHSGAMGSTGTPGNSICHIGEGVTIMTASRQIEKAIEEKGHGIFTTLLLEALRGGAADINGQITPGSIYAFIDRAMGAWSQRPVFKTNVVYFASLRKIPPRVSKEILRQISQYFPKPTDEHSLDPSYEYTNTPKNLPQIKHPLADKTKVAIFKDLQKLQSAGLVVPTGEEHLYWAAMNFKSCRLTPLGEYYWKLVTNKKI